MNYTYTSCLKPYIESFLQWQQPSVGSFTYDHYCKHLESLDHFLNDNDYCDVNLTEHQVLAWIATIPCKASTVCSYVGAIRSFFAFLNGYNLHPFMPPYPKIANDYIAYDFTAEEIKLIFSTADNYQSKGNTKTVKYKYCSYELPMILRILYGCGLRLSEACSLQIKDIDFGQKTFVIPKTKNKKQRIVPMDESLFDILLNYCSSMGLVVQKEDYLFPGESKSKPIPSYCIRNYFNRVLEISGIDVIKRDPHERGACLHCFRHTFAHSSFKKGAAEGWAVNDQIPWLSIYLGHNSLNETEKYLKFNSDVFPDEIAVFDDFSINLLPEVNFNE